MLETVLTRIHTTCRSRERRNRITGHRITTRNARRTTRLGAAASSSSAAYKPHLPMFLPLPRVRVVLLIGLSSLFRSSSFWARGALRGTFFFEMHPLAGSRHRKDRPVDLLSRVHIRGTHGPVITSLARILIRA